MFLFLNASVTASGTVANATAHCDDNEQEDKVGHSDVPDPSPAPA